MELLARVFSDFWGPYREPALTGDVYMLTFIDDYTRECTVNFGNGNNVTFSTGGKVNNVQYSDAWMHIEDEDIDHAKTSIQSGDGSLVDTNGVKADSAKLAQLGSNSKNGLLTRRFVA
jgi:hypothetical protein